LPTSGKRKRITVVYVYRDIEKYRAKNKLIELSGTRVENLGLLATLKDESKRKFDLILAWCKDRFPSA
jgi:hypothetical protein